jgi:hypothetical protein
MSNQGEFVVERSAVVRRFGKFFTEDFQRRLAITVRLFMLCSLELRGEVGRALSSAWGTQLQTLGAELTEDRAPKGRYYLHAGRGFLWIIVEQAVAVATFVKPNDYLGRYANAMWRGIDPFDWMPFDLNL